MQLILAEDKYKTLLDFYQSRALKIFVPYYTVFFLILGLSIVTGIIWGNWMTLSKVINPEGIGSTGFALTAVTNLTLFFQDWVMFFEHDATSRFQFTSNFWNSEHPLWETLLIPQAWSIGVELTFYAIVPFLAIRRSTGVLILLAALCILLRLNIYRLGVLNDPWTYRFFPFELTHFIYGMLGCRLLTWRSVQFSMLKKVFEDWSHRLRNLALPVQTISILILLGIHSYMIAGLQMVIAKDSSKMASEIISLLSLIPWIVIVPILFVLTRNCKFDRSIGELSYPVYLLHYTVAIVIGSVVAKLGIPTFKGVITAIVTIGLAVLLQRMIFNPFESWRQKFIQMKANRRMRIR
jgi:peptidoglycan/LPS O-acetylase OafA/YrhL